MTPTFGRRVVHVAGPRNHFVDRADAENLSGGTGNILLYATALELLNRLAGTEEVPGQIHRDDTVPLVERHVFEPGILLQAGVVHEDVDRAKFVEHPAEHRADVVFLRDVRLVGEDAAAAEASFLDGRRGRRFVGVIVDDDIRAGVC